MRTGNQETKRVHMAVTESRKWLGGNVLTIQDASMSSGQGRARDSLGACIGVPPLKILLHTAAAELQ